MSELRADTITGSDGSSPVTLTKQSAAKVIAAMDSTATALGTANLNLSSGTDNGTGDYTVTTINAFTSANECIAGYSPRSTDDVAGSCFIASSSTIRVRVVDISGHVNEDKNTSTFGFGDLA
jgi:hypothetical protein